MSVFNRASIVILTRLYPNNQSKWPCMVGTLNCKIARNPQSCCQDRKPQDQDQDQDFEPQDQDQDLWSQDQDQGQDFCPQDQDQDQDFNPQDQYQDQDFEKSQSYTHFFYSLSKIVKTDNLLFSDRSIEEKQ